MENQSESLLGKKQKKDTSGKFRLQAKNIFLTYPKCYAEKESLLEFLITHKSLDPKYVLIGKEKHADGTPHLHAYVQNKEKIDIRSPKALDFGDYHGNYVPAKGNYYEVYDYITKEDKGPVTWGEALMARNRAEETKLGIAARNKMLAESRLPALVDSGDIRMESYCQIKKCVQNYRMDSLCVGGFMERRTCVWLCDHPGKGKSRWVRDTFPEFHSKSQSKWWDGYTQQPVVVLDDFDQQGKCLSHYVKIWSDKYSFHGEVKGGTVPCNYQIFIITSNYWPNEIWKEEEDMELVKAVERRFHMVNLSAAIDLTKELQDIVTGFSLAN